MKIDFIGIYRKSVPTKSTVLFPKPGAAVGGHFYRFLPFFCVFRPALEPDKSTEKPGCIEGLFSGIRHGGVEISKNGQK
jgi:hypothetical protein